MNKQLQNILGDAKSAYKKQIEESQKLVNKWEGSGLLDGLKSEYEKSGMAILLENQARQLLDEISSSGTSANSEEWSGVALPLVRRIFGEIAAKEFVSVQPMNIPSGLVFYLDFKYGTAQPGFNTSAGASGQANTLHGITNQAADASEGLYGAGRFGYSINDVTASIVSATGSVTWADVNYQGSLSGSISSLQKITVPMTGLNIDKEGVRAFKISGSVMTDYYPQFTSVDSSDNVTFIVVGTELGTPTMKVWYHKQPTDITRGDFEATADPAYTDTADQHLDIPEINVALKSIPIVAKTRKLKAVWTPEFAQDLNAYHSIDAEAELTGVLSEYISMEIDLEILDMLILNAITTDVWSARIAQVNTGTNTWSTMDSVQGVALAYTQQAWFQTLGTKIQKVSNKIHQKTMRGGANFIVTSPNVATVLESIPGYAVDTDGDKMQFAMGVQKVGMLNNRFQVYKNPYMKEEILLLGFRGSQFLETGAVFAPYVPLIMTPLIYDPTNFTPRKGVMTRYAKEVVRPEFYGKIKVADLNYV